MTIFRIDNWDFPGGPVIKTLGFQCRGHGYDHWSRTKIPHAVQQVKKRKTFPNKILKIKNEIEEQVRTDCMLQETLLNIL